MIYASKNAQILRLAFAVLFTAFAGWTAAQSASADDLYAFNEWRLQRQKTGMFILGGWAAGNIALGAVLAGQREGSAKYFHQMNAGWNVVNLGIATLGYLSVLKTDPGSLDLFNSMQQHHQIQKILLFNAGLDVAYMAGGAYLIERSKNTEKRPERLKGFGQSIILQGGFLFAFDLAQYAILASGNTKLQPLLSHIGPTANGIGLSFTF